MFIIDKETKQINITRGDIGKINVDAIIEDQQYIFKPDDIVRFKVFKVKECENVVLQKDIKVAEETKIVTIPLTGENTKIGDYINKPTKYWYEIELNPDTNPQTIICYDKDGEKIFMLYPEGGNKQ